MPDKIIKELADIILSHDQPNLDIARQNDIKLGLRNEDGSGVVVGMTTKGTVRGYVKGSDNKVQPVEGKLMYCGIDIHEIVNAHTDSFGYEETAYLLLTGILPTQTQLERFSQFMKERGSVSHRFIQNLIQNTTPHMMNSLQLALQSLYEEAHFQYSRAKKQEMDPDSTSIEAVTLHSVDILARFPALVAYTNQIMDFKYGKGNLHIVNGGHELDYAPHFLHMFHAGRPITREEALLMDLFLVLHAEHGGGNNSTFATRVVSSAETDTYSAINAGLASLKGHLHGGANEQVMAMMKDIQDNVSDWKDADEVNDYLAKIIRKEAGDRSGKIYGLGHAVYTLSDPRALILREKGRTLAEAKGRGDEFDLLMLVGEAGPKVFSEVKGSDKVIAPNVDFYSGFFLDCLGIPVRAYTPLFAMARIAGWAAHRLEQLAQNRIMRPAYFNLAKPTQYVTIEKRTST